MNSVMDWESLGVSDVGLGVELVLSVHPALNLARADRLDDCGNPVKEVVLLLRGFDAVIEPTGHACEAFIESLLRTARNLVAHEQPNAIHLLPFAFEIKQCADLEIPRGNVDRL